MPSMLDGETAENHVRDQIGMLVGKAFDVFAGQLIIGREIHQDRAHQDEHQMVDRHVADQLLLLGFAQQRFETVAEAARIIFPDPRKAFRARTRFGAEQAEMVRIARREMSE